MAKVGRPTKYKPEFCERVIEFGKEGMSKAEMAVNLGIAYSNFDTWTQEKPEFREAVKEAVRQSQAWWEAQGRIATFGGIEGYNATSYIFQMKNRFRDDWNDKTTTELQGSVKVESEDVVAELAALLDAKSDRSSSGAS